MSDETTPLIVGDAIAAASEENKEGRRRWLGFGRRRKATAAALTHCENCGADLHGRYCASCGQAAIDYRRSLRHVIVDVLDSFLNWDSKFITTVGLLILKPWRLTNEFVAGRRVRYVHPLRLYLLASVLFFFAASFGAKSLNLRSDNDKTSLPAKAAGRGVRKAENAGEGVHADFVFGSDNHPARTPFERWMESRVKEKFGEDGTRAKVFVVTLVSNLPYMMMGAIPLFAFVLKILYIRRHILYIDHLVYALHIHSFAYVAATLIGLAIQGIDAVAPSLSGWLNAALIILSVAQVFLSIRRVYRQSWLMTVLKFGFGGVIYFFVLSFALAVTFMATLALP